MSPAIFPHSILKIHLENYINIYFNVVIIKRHFFKITFSETCNKLVKTQHNNRTKVLKKNVTF